MEENKRDKFIRIAENRTNKIIAMIRLLSNCANRSNYDYNVNDVNKIFEAIKEELNDAKSKFASNNKKNSDFKLK